MTPKEQAAMQQALEALEGVDREFGSNHAEEQAITALREALAIRCHGCDYCNNPLFAGTKCNNCGRVVEQTVSQEYQDHLVNQSFDWSEMAAKHQFMEGYRIGLAEMREKCATVSEQGTGEAVQKAALELLLNERKRIAAAIRAIKFEGDTGFRPVSEMIAEHKQDPKKGAAIEKAKVRKATRAEKIAMSGVYEVPVEQAEQEPVAYVYEKDVAGIGMRKDVAFTKHVEVGTDLYAAPVRTKDLTDDELNKLLDYWSEDERSAYGGAWQADGEYVDMKSFARAVIAADREKNK